MKKILIFGINEKVHSTLRVMEELEKKKIGYDFVKWGSINFFKRELILSGKIIDFKKYVAVFFDTPSYYFKNGEKATKRISFDLSNEFFVILKKVKESKLFAMNLDFFLEHPFYNKFTQSIIFNKKRIPSIPTLHLTDNTYEKVVLALRKASFKFPLVVKESGGGLGGQVWKLGNYESLKKFLKNKKNANFIYQPFIENDGDFRVLVISGKSLGIMKRSAQKREWRNNFALGGKIEAYRDPAMERFAEDVCNKMGMDYAGIDILKVKKRYVVIEVNSFARFKGFEQTYPQINVGETIVDYLSQRNKN